MPTTAKLSIALFAVEIQPVADVQIHTLGSLIVCKQMIFIGIILKFCKKCSLRRLQPIDLKHVFRNERTEGTYSKNESGLQRTLDVLWAVHNFIRTHFTTKQVPAVAPGILDKQLSWDILFMIPMTA